MFRKKFFIFATVLLIIYLATSNFYMYRLFNNTTEKITRTDISNFNIISYIENRMGPYFWILDTQKKNDMISVNMNGGFYDNKTSKNIDNENMFLYIMGENNYKLESTKAFSPILERNGNLAGAYNGFNSNFNTYIMKNGIYSFGIQENDNKIIKSTERKIYKKNEKVRQIAYDLDDNEYQKLVNGDYLAGDNSKLVLGKPAMIEKIESNLYKLSGILFIKDEQIDSYDSIAFIKIITDNESKVYRIPMTYNEWMYKNVGSYARISMFVTKMYINDFEKANIEYMILNNNKLYTHDKIYYYQNKNDNITLSYTHQGYNIEYNPVYDNMLREQYIGIDKNNGNNFTFRGAIYKENGESSDYDIIVEVRNEEGNFSYVIPKQYSKYMTDRLGDKYAYSHILLQLSTKQLSDNGVIKLYLKNGDNYYTTDREYIYSFENNKYLINKIYDNKINEKYIGIDKNNDNTFTFRGAIYKENAESSNYNIIVEVKNENGDIKYNIPKMYSKYMADMLGEKYAYSHILLQLSKEQLGDNGVIKLYLKNGDNYYTTGREYTYSLKNNEYSIK